MKKFLVLLALLLTMFFSFSGCASFGVWGGVDRINETDFIVSVSIPPISGGGTFGNSFKTALGIAKQHVKDWGYKYFILIGGETGESHNFNSFVGATFVNTNGQFQFRILEESQLTAAREAGLSVLDADY